MAADIIMEIGSIIFLFLFSLLMFTLVIFIISIFVKKKYPKYEPRVSIIVPCRNEEKNIFNCLTSIFSLNYPKNKIEVVVIDDDSSDNTYNILKNFKKKHEKFKLKVLKYKRSKDEIGKWLKPKLLNICVKKSSHGVVLVIDADSFVDKNALKRVVLPLQYKEVGAANGSCLVKNTNNLIEIFQNIEYYHHNLSRRIFSDVFGNVIWFFGAFACYKKEVIKKMGYFKGSRMGEDMDILMAIYNKGYQIKNVHSAFVYTLVPNTLKEFYKQRLRWWLAALDSLKKNKSLFSIKSNFSMLFLFFNHYWWTLYSFMIIPLIAYQMAYWLPYNNQSFVTIFMYFFRWFTLIGPVYVLYMIPVWGVSWYNIFGVLSGVVSVLLVISAVYMFRGKLDLKNIICIFFYFPYTLLLNTTILVSAIKKIFLKNN